MTHVPDDDDEIKTLAVKTWTKRDNRKADFNLKTIFTSLGSMNAVYQ